MEALEPHPIEPAIGQLRRTLMSDYRLARLEADVRNLTIAVRDLTSRVGALQSLIATDLPTQIRTQRSNAIAGVA
jgi:hypothetical protein